MDGLNGGWDNRAAQQRLDDAGLVGKMAGCFDHQLRLDAGLATAAKDAAERATTSRAESDLDYFRMRAAREQAAARNAGDLRVRRVHLEMAELYRLLARDAEARSPARLRLVS